MKIFRKVVGTQCLGQVDPACPNYVNKTQLPPHKRYDECGSPMREITATNFATVLGLLVAVIIVVGGSGGYFYYRAHQAAIQVASEAEKAIEQVGEVISDRTLNATAPSNAEKSMPELRQKVDDAILTVAFKNGVGYASSGMYENAIKEFSTVERSSPKYPSLQMNMGAAYLQLKQYAQAREYLERAQQQTPVDPNVLFNLACLSAATGKSEGALQQLRAAVDHGFRNVEALKSDPDLASIRNLKEFAPIVKSASGH